MLIAIIFRVLFKKTLKSLGMWLSGRVCAQHALGESLIPEISRNTSEEQPQRPSAAHSES